MADDTELKRTFANTTEQLRYVAKEKSCWACTVGQFFETFVENKDDEYQVSIPPYQKDYAWTEVQLNQLLSDLGKVKDRELGGAYHLGTIILHRNGNRLDVVDGQQRLRTFDLILNGGDPHLGYDDKTPDGRKAFENAKKLMEKTDNILKEALRHGTLVCIAVDNLNEAFQLFETQNNCAQELSPANLLKAFHYGEMCCKDAQNPPSREKLYDLEGYWEADVASKDAYPILTDALFFIRRWSRGEKKMRFRREEHLGEYKGATLYRDAEERGAPWQNVWILCHFLRKSVVETGMLRRDLMPKIKREADIDDLPVDPFVSITQPIINGENFFEYARTYAVIAKLLFIDRQTNRQGLLGFYTFYNKYCLGEKKERTGDIYARRVYEAFVMVVVDRFGSKSIERPEVYRPLWLLAYRDRLASKKLRFESAGEQYGKVVYSILSSKSSIADVVNELDDKEKEVKLWIRTEVERVNTNDWIPYPFVKYLLAIYADLSDVLK